MVQTMVHGILTTWTIPYLMGVSWSYDTIDIYVLDMPKVHFLYWCIKKTHESPSMTPVWDPGQPETKISITQIPPECESKISENSLYYWENMGILLTYSVRVKVWFYLAIRSRLILALNPEGKICLQEPPRWKCLGADYFHHGTYIVRW